MLLLLPVLLLLVSSSTVLLLLVSVSVNVDVDVDVDVDVHVVPVLVNQHTVYSLQCTVLSVLVSRLISHSGCVKFVCGCGFFQFAPLANAK